MPIDYQQQIKEIFGTSDLDELRELAKMLKINHPNPRNAGRKAQLTPDQIVEVLELHRKGIDIDFKHEVVRMKNYTDRIPLRAFGVVENPFWADFEEFLKERCLPASRAGLKGILREMDVPFLTHC